MNSSDRGDSPSVTAQGPQVTANSKRFRTGDQGWVRERNLAILMNYLWTEGHPISRTRLTATSGLNKTTVGSLLTQLQSWGFVRESGIQGRRPGRPGALFQLNEHGGRIIGMEIGVGFVSVIVGDLHANVLWRSERETTANGTQLAGASLDVVWGEVERMVAEGISAARRDSGRLLGMGVGVPGIVDVATGRLLFAPNLHWQDVPVGDLLRNTFGIPVVVSNEANAAALGEWMFGVARGVENFVYLSAGVGLGGGLIVNGHLYGGAEGYAGEVGHMTLIPDGPPCNCGNRGCWEVLVGPAAIVQRVREAAAAGHAPLLWRRCGGHLDAIGIDDIRQAAEDGEQVVLATLHDVGRYLGIGIANLINVFNPTHIVLGGVLSLFGPFIVPSAQEVAYARAIIPSRQNVQICLSSFRFDACAMGGMATILREVLDNPTAWAPIPATPTAPRRQLEHSTSIV